MSRIRIETTTGTGQFEYNQVNDGDLVQYGDFALYFDDGNMHIAYYDRRTGTYSFMHGNKNLIINLNNLNYKHDIFR